MTFPSNLDRDAFAGTAELYAIYRPPYPSPMLEDLLARAAVGSRVLLDLATGPGRLALALADRFERITAVDLEPEMIAVGQATAKRLRIDNVAFELGRAEDLLVDPESVDLITIGEAFHRLEQTVVAQNALRWLRPGGCLATLGTDGRFIGDEPWEVRLRETRGRWLVHLFPGGQGRSLPEAALDEQGRESVLRAAGFVDIEERRYAERRELTVEEIVGYLESTSVCSGRLLGDQLGRFEAEVRRAVAPSPGTLLTETIHWGYTLARKPEPSGVTTEHPGLEPPDVPLANSRSVM